MALGLCAISLAASACATALESRSRSEITSLEPALVPAPAPAADEVPTFDGSLDAYLAFALGHSPETRASFERWRAAVLGTSRARRLPDPMLSFGYFLRRVETRVGPQRFRIGVTQAIPWPTRLGARSDAAAERARAAGLAFAVQALAVRKVIALAYWDLWLVSEEHRLKSDHDAVLEALAGAVRGRLTTGAASLADLNQVELTIARHHDHRGLHEEMARKASARLVAALGLTGQGQRLAVRDQPPAVGVPMATDAALRDFARAHPVIAQHQRLAASEEQHARAENADRYPELRLGVDYIDTGEAIAAGVPDSGKDPIVVSAGLSVPLWAGSYSDAERAARAAAKAHEADADAATRRAEAALEMALSDVRDAFRRAQLYAKTLVPQAQATYQAVLGGYETGHSTVAAAILAQRDLLELQLELARARAEWAKAWAELELAVGKELAVKGEER